MILGRTKFGNTQRVRRRQASFDSVRELRLKLLGKDPGALTLAPCASGAAEGRKHLPSLGDGFVPECASAPERRNRTGRDRACE